MLRIKKVRKSKKSLGSVVGKEASVKLVGSDFSGADTFVKYGRELMNFKDLAVQWNSTLFDTALNHPRRPWGVISGDGKPMVLIVKNNEVVAVDGGSHKSTKMESGNLEMEDYSNANSTILLMNDSAKELLVALDNFSGVSSFKVVAGNKLESAGWTAESSGGILPVLRHDQSSAYVVVNNGENPSLYRVESGLVKSGKISLNAPASAWKLMATKNNEVLHVSSQGLNVYSIAGQSSSLKFYCPLFSLKQGWTQQFVDTLKLMKLDGNQEAIIGTGPKGIEYFPLSPSCKIYVADVDKVTEKDNMNAKHAQIAATSAKNGNQFDVLGYYHGELYEITLQVEEAKKPNLKEGPTVSELKKINKVTPSNKVRVSEGETNPKPTRWLRDSIDESSFKNIVDKLTGKVQFSFPLIDLQDRMGLPIKLVAYYEETDTEEMSVLGRYWTLGKDCIVLDHGNSVFEDLQGYYLVKDQMKIKLERDLGAQSGNTIRFNMQGNKNVTFDYDEKAEKWEAGNGKVRYVYGIKDQGAVTVPAWKDWNGPSGKFDPSKNHVVQWNLVEIKNEFSAKVRITFGYTKKDPKTNMIHLNSISDGDKTLVKFQYQDIQGVGQRVDSRLAKEHKFINEKLLTGIVIDIPNYLQSLKITSTKIDNLYYLESIGQAGDGDSVLGFKYNTQDQLKPRLAQIQLPSKSTLEFEYKKQSVPTQGFQQDVAKLSDLYSGSGYSLLITKESEETRLKIEQRDSSGWNYSIKDATVFVENYEARSIQSYQPFMQQNYFAVVVSYQDAGSKIYIFNKDQNNSWKQESEGTLASQVFNDKLFKYDFQENSFVYYAAGKINLEYKKSGSVKWTRLSHQIGIPDMIVLLKRGAVFYKDDLKLIRWDDSDNLKQATLTTAGGKPNVKDVESFFTYIDLQGSDPSNQEESKKEIDEYKKELIEQFNANGLVMFNNLVALRTAELTEQGKATMKVFLYLLGKDYGVSSLQTITLDGDDLGKFNLTLDVFDEFKSKDPNNLDKYRFEYRRETNLYKLKFVSATDMKGEPTEPSKENKQSIGMYERKMRIPLDFEKYMMQVNQDGIILGNQQIYHSNGNFQTKPMDRDSLKLTKFQIPLGDYTVFKKESADDEVKVCSVGQVGYCESLSTNSARNVSVKYPYYMIAQRRNDVIVLPLKSRGFEKRVEYPSEVLHGSTSHSVLVTTRMSDNATLIRPLKSLNKDNTISVQVIVQEKLSTPNDEYTIRYEYSDPVLSNAEVLFRKAVVIPGGQKQVTGYYEETTDLQTNQQVVQVMTSDNKVFDPEYVKRMHEMEDEQKKQQDRPQVDEDGTIFDASRNRPILKTKPYAANENLVHFVGFEDYEDLRGWNFVGDNIQRNAFSATGRNYLLLKGNDQLVKELKGVTYYDYFVASAWIRTTQDVSLGDSTDVIAVEIDGQKIKGEIKQLNGEWIYVEATTRNYELHKSEQPKKVNLKVTLKSAGAKEIHVDHVRISPLNFDFEANVYDAQTGRTAAVIRNNGQVSHRAYDIYNRRVAEVSEQGLVKFLASYTKRVQMKSLTGSIQEGSGSSRVQIRPKKGWLESFSPYSVDKRWELGGSGNKVHPRVLQLQGMATYKHRFSGDSIAIRMIYTIPNSGQLQLTLAKISVVLNNGMLKCGSTSTTIPKNGELIVLTTPKVVTIWVEGHIVHEAVQSASKFNNEAVSIQASPYIEIKDLVIMENTEVQVSYLNRDSKPLQEVLLQDSDNILVRQLVYDTIGRKVAETVWTKLTIGSGSGSKVFQYRENFVQNDGPTGSFLTTGKMQGSVISGNEMYSGYPYSQTEYYNNPLEIRRRAGHPGEKYSLKGEFKHEYTIESNLSFIKLYYPKEKGFRQEQEKKSNGKTQVIVYNRRNKKVAEFIQVSDYNNILTTYAYNERSNQVQMIPPNYYDEKNKASKTAEGFKPELNEIESPWVTTTKYDPSGEYVLMKLTPDGGRVEFLYNDLKQLTYQLHYAENDKKVDKIVYFLYNAAGKVCEAGKLEATSQVESLVRQKGKSYQDIPNRQNAIYFDYGESDPNPSVRGRMQRVVKRNNEVHFDEALFYDEDGNMIAKTYISPVKNESLSLEYLQENDKIGGIRYPFLVDGDQLVLKFHHNLRGETTRVSRVKISGQNKVDELPIVDIDHDAQGKVTRIGHKYGSYSFDQSYVYKAPGYLSSIQNEFLNETLYYTSNGYGTEPTGDGSILRTEFQAKWHDRCNQNLIPLTARAFVSNRMSLDLAEVCFDSLNSLGYFDQMGRPQKTYYPDLEANMPVACSTGSNRKHISSMIFKKGYPENYGHAYDYGTHGELIAAKAFVGKEKDDLEPPLKESYAVENLSRKIPISDRRKASTLWNDLVKSNLIDRVNGIKAFYRGSGGLSVDVMANVAHILHTNKLEGLPDPKCEHLLRGSDEKKHKNKCEDFMKTIQNPPMESKFKTILEQNANIKSKLVSRLWKMLASALGNSPGDVESFSIDPNGNHRVFYTGFNRYEIEYKAQKNQIATIKQEKNSREIQHDSEGNVVKALHKNIEKIEYDPLTQRVSRIELTNKSRVIEFGFDFRGERTLKRVRNREKQVISETYYVRDNKGNTLVEYKLDYPNPSEPTKSINTVTAYIHGPLGLLGFFRNNKYYNVLLDHEGSTRLVIHNGEVVAAYDYFPYGQLMRSYGSNPEAHISYRYTGQEFDEETGLYNYHARLYDPDIGRFFQMDPMEQYASPYKYAGNSPISQIDPDGQIAITLIVMAIGALVGAYLGASSANNSWNPAKWAWDDKKTWIGIFAGAAMGAMAVYGGGATFSYFAGMFGSTMAASLVTGAISVAGAFLGAAAAANEWNPAKWDWSSPSIWNGFLNGISIALSFPSGFVGIKRTFFSFAFRTSKIIYGVAMSSGFLLLLYVGASMANNFNFRLDTWDWKSPRTWFGMVEGVSTLFLGTASAVKHGATKTHFIVQPNNIKLAWYRINIPAKSFTVKQVGNQFVMTWYKYGNRMGIQIVKSEASLLKYSKPVVGFTEAFFISHAQRAKSVLAMGMFGGFHVHNFQTYFAHEPKKMDNTTEQAQPAGRRKRFALNSDHPAASSSTSSSGWMRDFVEFVTEFFESADPTLQSSNYMVNHGLKQFTAPTPSEPSGRSFEKLCYSPSDGQNNHVICPQRESIVNVFSKQSSFDSENFGKDTFTNCMPLSWQQFPSVACDGQQTSFVYTPNPGLRVFDLVDGWLLLARVTPAAVKNLKAGFNFLKDSLFSTRSNIKQLKQLEYHKLELAKDLVDLRNVMLNAESTTNVDWAKPILQDLEDDIDEFRRKKSPEKADLVLLQERIESLRDELVDDVTDIGTQHDVIHAMAKELGYPLGSQRTEVGEVLQAMQWPLLEFESGFTHSIV